jgi:putative transcriptional regulator
MADPPLKGRLLVAQPALRDPNFDRSVVLILEHSEAGAIGLILNRPGAFPLADITPEWALFAPPPAVVFAGGPVSDEAKAICLARIRGEARGDGWSPLSDSVGTLDLTLSPEEVESRVEEVRLFAGYAGWGGGQLEAEIAGGGWFVVDARPVDAFTNDPAGLWKAVLGRQRGLLAWFATFPPDVRYN